MPIVKEISDMLNIGQKPSEVILVVFFTSKLAKIAKEKCSQCAMALDYQFQCLSTAPSNRIIAPYARKYVCLRFLDSLSV